MSGTRDPFEPSDPGWLLTFDGWDPAREPAIEAICALVNGYCGVRAAVEEGSSAASPGTYLNGVFDEAREMASQASATPEHAVVAAPTSELVRAPEWSAVRLLAGGEPLDLDACEVVQHRRTLDLARGVLVREWALRTAAGLTRFRSLRFASLDPRHLVGQILEVASEDWSGDLVVEAALDADVVNDGGGRHLGEVRSSASGAEAAVAATTISTGVDIALAGWARLLDAHGRELPVEAGAEERAARQRWRAEVGPGLGLRLERLVAIATSRDAADAPAAARERLGRARPGGVAEAVARSADAWAGRWADADVRIAGDPDVQRQARFAVYHLIGCANPDDDRASPGARSLTGERYKGHVFWDTEIFVLPFFVYTHPPTARALLAYRHHTLPAARDRAIALGYRGALFAWESTDTGVDLTPPFVINSAGERLEILTGEQEHHISADVGLAVARYWDATGDDEFMAAMGVEIMIEVARFWSSRATEGDDGRHHVLGVIGPDEYHEGVDDNAYTNRTARFCLRRASAAAGWMRETDPDAWRRLADALALDDAEPAAWTRVADGLADGTLGDDGLLEQHRGFAALEPADLAAFEPRTSTMDVLLGWERLVRTQILKQADVLMLPVVLPDELDRGAVAANYHYYEPRTSHDSSLSAAVHALVAARIGHREDAVRYFDKAATIDLDLDRGVTAAGGVHIAALGGMWQALVFGFCGVSEANGGLEAEAAVPAAWGSIDLTLQRRGARFEIRAAA